MIVVIVIVVGTKFKKQKGNRAPNSRKMLEASAAPRCLRSWFRYLFPCALLSQHEHWDIFIFICG